MSETEMYRAERDARLSAGFSLGQAALGALRVTLREVQEGRVGSDELREALASSVLRPYQTVLA